MPNKAHLIIMAAALVILAAGLGYVAYRQNPPAPKVSPPSPTAPSASSQPPAPAIDTSNWKTYQNDKYGFEFKYPHSSSIEQERGDYIRFQNYTATDDRPNLNPGEYYLEITISNHKPSSSNGSFCLENIMGSRPVDLGVVKGWIGYGIEGGDAGGIRFALCAERSVNDFIVQVTENDKSGKIATQILSTFKFFN